MRADLFHGITLVPFLAERDMTRDGPRGPVNSATNTSIWKICVLTALVLAMGLATWWVRTVGRGGTPMV